MKLLLSIFFSLLFVNSSFACDNNPDAQDIGGQNSRDQEVCVIGPNRQRKGSSKSKKMQEKKKIENLMAIVKSNQI